MAKSQTQQKDSGHAHADKAKAGPDASGLEVGALHELSMLADRSAQVSQLQGLSEMAQTSSSAHSSSPPVQLAGDDKGVSVSLQQELVLLEGELSWGSKALGFVGMDTTFARITEAVKRYTAAKTADQKESAKAEVLSLGNSWLENHKDSKKKGDDKKRASIQRIVQSLSQADRQVELGVSIREDTIEGDYKLFRDSASGTVSSVGDLYALFQKAKETKDGIDGWRRQHPRPESPVDVEKARTLKTMEDTMASMNLNMWFEPYFSASAKGIDLPSLAQGIYSVREVTVNVKLLKDQATGTMTNVIVGPNGLIFDHFSLDFGGDIDLSDGFKIAGPSLEISSKGDSYSVSAEGELSLAADGVGWVKDLKAGGTVKGGYDFSESQFLDPKIDGGYLTATLFDSIKVDVRSLSYAAGVLSAGSGSLEVTALDKTVVGTVGGLTYSKAEGVGLTDAKITSTSDYEPVPGFTVSQPTLELRKTAAGWTLHGSGNLAVQMSGAQYNITKLDARVTLDYSVHDKQTGFALERGNMDVTVFDSLNVRIEELGYSSATKKLTAATGGVSITMFEKPFNATMNNISYEPGTGFDFQEAVFESPADFEPVTGFKLSSPALRLIKDQGGWKVDGQGTLVFNLGSGDAIRLENTEARLKLKYDPKSGTLEDLSMVEGGIDLALYDHVHLIGRGIAFDRSTGALTIDNMVVTLTGAAALGADSITGEGSGLVVRKGGFDWKSIKLNYNKQFEVGGFTFKPPFAVITRKANSYQVELNDMKGEVSVGDSLNFAGTANMLWDPETGGAPKITGASLKGGMQGDLVSDYLAAFGGKLAFSTGFSIPFAAGPVPMEAFVEFGGRASAPIELKLALDHTGESFQLSGELALNPQLTLYVKAGVGVGSSLLIYGGVYVKGELTSTSTARIGVTGSAKAANDYRFDNLVVDYGLGSDLKARISAGGEIKFLYFFNQELYEVQIKEWPIGESKLEGRYDLLNKRRIGETGTKLFDQMGDKQKKGDSIGIPLPDAEYHSKSYMAAIRKLNKAIDTRDSWRESELRESKGAEALERHKTKVKAAFEAFIESNSKKLTNLENRKTKNEAVMNAFLESHKAWLARQQSKLATAQGKEARRERVSRSRWGHLQTSEHYTKKIDQGNQKFENKAAPKRTALEKLVKDHELMSEELRNVRLILSELDAILNPDGTFNMDALASRASGSRAKVEEAVAEADAIEDTAPEVFDFKDSDVR